MKFKKNILGLAIVTSIAGFSLPALAAQVDAPLALAGVLSTAPAIDQAGLDSTAADYYTTMNNAYGTNVTNQGAATTAAGDLSDHQALIAASQARTLAANALSTGQLIGGETKAEILAAEVITMGSVADGTGLLSLTAGLEATVASTADAAATSQAAQDAIAAGVISADILVGLKQDTLFSAQDTAVGALTDGDDTTLGGAVAVATSAVGTADSTGSAGDATGLFLAKYNADAAVVTAQTAVTTNGADAVESTVAAVVGTASTTTFTVTDADVIDIRDDNAQVTMTIGTTAANDAAALVAAINGASGLSVTASAVGDNITLTYDDAGSATKVDTAGNTSAITVTGAVAGAQVDTAGDVAVTGGDVTYAILLADAQLAASEAATALSVGQAEVTTATAAYDSGVLVETSYATLRDTALTSAATKMTSAESVLSEDLTIEQAEQARLEGLAQAAEAISSEDAADVTSTAATVVTAQASKDAAQTAYDAAVATYIATPTDANQTAMTAAQAALATANTALGEAQGAATAAADVLYGAGNDAATSAGGTLAASVTARGLVTDQAVVVAAASASGSLQAQIASDASNPAVALQAELLKANDAVGKDSGGAMVAAVNSNFQVGKTNAADIATNTADIATNAAGISANVATLAVHEGLVTTNIANIATNTGNIATNTGNIATNTSNIASNTSSIADLSSSLADGVANLQRVEMQLNDDVDMLKSGIASALAIAGMPTAPGEGMGFSIGTGYYDGESAIAMGLTYVEGNRSYKFSLGNSGGETSASAGAAFKF